MISVICSVSELVDDVVDALLRIAEDAREAGKLFTDFGPENIKFIDSVPWY